MEDNELANTLQYSSPKELYVITYNNKLKLLSCPFRVTVLANVGMLRKKQFAWVSEVKVTTELKTIFIIDRSAYYYYYFDIILEEFTE